MARARAPMLVALLLLASTIAGLPTARAASGGAPMLLGLGVGGVFREELDDFTAQQGKAPAFFQIYWDPSLFGSVQPWAGGILSDMDDRGITGWVEWTTDDLAGMANGNQDQAIRNMYESIRSVVTTNGIGVVVAPLPEANLDEHPWSGDPVLYQRAFRRMRELVPASFGPDDIRFAFSMNGFSTRGRSFDQFYPGDEHVDLLAFARLNRGTDHPDGWRDYDDVFGIPIQTFREQVGTTKPIVVAQTGSVTSGGNRSTWLADLFNRLPGESQVVGAIYFNRDRGSDFRVHSKAAGIPLDPTFRSGYAGWSDPSRTSWLFDGSLDDWVTARGGTPAVLPASTDDPPPVGNPFGSNLAVTPRTGTGSASSNAIAISQVRFASDSARHAVLSRDDKFPDALAGTPLLGEGPLLLTPTSALAPSVRAEIDRVLSPGGRVYLLGGPGALAQGIEDELVEAGYDVRRLFGNDRFRTSAAIAQEVATLYPESSGTVLVARGFGTETNPTAAWADSVTGGGYAAFARTPVVLSLSHELSQEAAAFLAGRGRAVLLGGPGALQEQVRLDAQAQTGRADRVSGSGRDLTALAILTDLWQRPTGEFRMIVIDGYGTDGWAFGLPAAGLSADFGAPLLPAARDALPPGTITAVTSCFTKRVATVVIGTTAVISDAVLQAVEAQDDSC